MPNPWDRPTETIERNPWDRVEKPNYNMLDVASDTKTENNNFLGRAKEAFDNITILSEPTKMAAAGFETMVGNISGLLTILGDQVKPNDNIREQYVNMGKDNKRLQFADKVGDYLKKWGETSKTYWEEQAKKGWESELTEEVWEGTFFENPSFTRAISLGAGAVPSLAASVVAGSAGGPVAGLAFLGLVEGEPVYAEAIEKGVEEEKALGLFIATAAAISATEYIPLQRFLRGGSGKLVKDIIVGGVMGFTQEGSQQYITNIIRKIGIDDTVNLTEGIVDAAIGGIFSEGVMGGAMSGHANRQTNKVRTYVQERLDEVESRAAELGLSKEETDNLIMLTGDAMATKSDEIDTVIAKEIDTRLKEREKEVQERAEQPQITPELPSVEDLAAELGVSPALVQEARDVEDRGEFVAKNMSDKWFHGGASGLTEITEGYATRSFSEAQRYADEYENGVVYEVDAKNVRQATEKDFGPGVQIYDIEKLGVIDEAKGVPAKTKAQLTDIWNKAQEKVAPPAAPTPEGKQLRYDAVKVPRKAGENKLARSTKEFIDKAFVPISTRLSKVNETLKYAVRRFDFDVNTKTNDQLKQIEPALRKYSRLKQDVRIELDFALKNRDVERVDEIIKREGLEEDYKVITETLDDIFKRAEKVGLDINYLQDYFPRRIKDVQGFLDYLRQTEKWSAIQEALDEAAEVKGVALTEPEQAEFINKLIRGFGDTTIKLTIPGHVKARMIEEITPDMNVFYKDSSEALIDYITSMNNAIESRRFFGKGDNIDASIGEYIRKLVDDNMIVASQEKEVRDILKARFEQRGTHGLWSTYKNLSYIYTMGSPTSAVTQIGDQAFSIYKNGFYDTAVSIAKSIVGRNVITKEDLGIERIAEEFSDRSKAGKAVTKVFKLVGLEWMDNLGKNSLINGALKRMTKLANKPTQDFTDKMNNIFGDEAAQTIQDLKKGEITTNVKMLMFSELADVQPISLSEMPEYYLKGGNMRLFYMLKTYTIKLLDVYHNEVFRQIGTPGKRLKGLQNLVKLTTALMLMGATSDVIKDLLLGRDITVSDIVIDNLLKLMGFSKWQIYKSRKDGLLTAFMQSILPPVPFIDDMYKDIVNQKELPDWRVVKSVPFVGKFYYWWFGGGSEKGRTVI